jgi:hypothetical protein
MAFTQSLRACMLLTLALFANAAVAQTHPSDGDHAAYEKIFSRGAVRIGIGIGWLDPALDQGLTPAGRVQTIIGNLTRRCSESLSAEIVCGFRQLEQRTSTTKYYVLKRTIPNLHQGRSISFQITICNPNEAGTGPEQAQMCSELFDGSMGRDEITIYIGHSRGASGPDFFPPRMTADEAGQPVLDTSYYRRNRPGRTHFSARALAPGPRPQGLHYKQVYILGCKSDIFQTLVARSARQNGYRSEDFDYIGTTQNSFLDGKEALYIIESIGRSENAQALTQRLLQREDDWFDWHGPADEPITVPGVLPLMEGRVFNNETY